MMASMTTIQFLGDWRHKQHGPIERGGLLKVDYDKGRLPRCFTMWRGAEFGDIVAYLRRRAGRDARRFCARRP